MPLDQFSLGKHSVTDSASVEILFYVSQQMPLEIFAFQKRCVAVTAVEQVPVEVGRRVFTHGCLCVEQSVTNIAPPDVLIQMVLQMQTYEFRTSTETLVAQKANASLSTSVNRSVFP